MKQEKQERIGVEGLSDWIFVVWLVTVGAAPVSAVLEVPRVLKWGLILLACIGAYAIASALAWVFGWA